MSAIRIVWGTGTGPTDTAAYDAALAAAGVHEYNLVTVSSVLPAEHPLEEVGTAPDLGAPGDMLTVVQANATARADSACAGLGWARDAAGQGVVYEASGAERAAVEAEVAAGLAAGTTLRERPFTTEGVRCTCVEAPADEGTVAAAVVLAVLGEGKPLMDQP